MGSLIFSCTVAFKALFDGLIVIPYLQKCEIVESATTIAPSVF